MKKDIRVKFINQWSGDGIIANDSLIHFYIKKNFNLIIDNENPDFVVTQAFNREPLGKYKDKIIVFETGEAVVPDFNLVDYAIAYDPITYGDRYFQFPYHFLHWRDDMELLQGVDFADKQFCSFIYSNPNANPIRDEFFLYLSGIEQVDSYGAHLNNMCMEETRSNQNWRSLKKKILNKYKFNLAFENSNHLGYTTEKILDAYDAGTIPVYFGNDEIDKLCNQDSYLHVKSADDFFDTYKKMKRIAQSHEIFNQMVTQNKLSIDIGRKEDELEEFINNIFNQDVSIARRRAVGTAQDRQSFLSVADDSNNCSYYQKFKKNFRRWRS